MHVLDYISQVNSVLLVQNADDGNNNVVVDDENVHKEDNKNHIILGHCADVFNENE